MVASARPPQNRRKTAANCMNTSTSVDKLREVCPNCHTTHGVTAGRLAQGLGVPGGQAPVDSHPVALGGADLDGQLAASDLPVVVDFWAPWCGPCRRVAPVFECVARELAPQLRFVKVNTDEEQALEARHGIRGIPTLVIFRHSVEVARRSGALDAASLMAWVCDNALAPSLCPERGSVEGLRSAAAVAKSYVSCAIGKMNW